MFKDFGLIVLLSGKLILDDYMKSASENLEFKSVMPNTENMTKGPFHCIL